MQLPVIQPSHELRPIPGRKHHRLRVGLVSMPLSSTRLPSIQLGLLQAIVARYGVDARCHYLNLSFAKRVGWDVNAQLCETGGAPLLGDWLFAAAAFGDHAPDGAAYVTEHEPRLREVCAAVGRDVDFLERMRNETVPAFLDECLAAIDWPELDVVGFSSVFQQNCASIALARRIKAAHPSVQVVFGGANFDGKMGLEYLRTVDCIDYAVIGEGDVAFPALLRRIAAGEDAAAVPGVAYARDGVVEYQPAERIRELGALPIPDYDDFFAAAHELELPATVAGAEVSVPFESARGCWWGAKHHCTFCGIFTGQMAFRSKSPKRVREEVDALADRYGVPTLFAVDNIMDQRYVAGLFQPLSEERKDYRIGYQVKSNLRREHLRTMARGGAHFVQPGIESLSTHVLGLMDKGATMLQNVRFLKWATYYGITVNWHILRGFPGERDEDYQTQLHACRLIPHLQPPTPYTHEIRIDRFSPNFNRAGEKGFANLRPASAYACVYPPMMDIGRIAYTFRADTAIDVPPEVYAALDEQLAWWQRAWETSPPTMLYRSGPDELRIEDRRDTETPTVHVLQGAAARIYEACSESYGTARSIARAWTGEAPSVDEIEAQLDAFARAGLALHEDGRYLSLALPLNPHY